MVAAALAGGCAAAGPTASSVLMPHSQPAQAHTQTSVNLAQGNFVVLKTNVVGQSKGFSLLGFITIYPARLTTAMDRLYAKAGIQPGGSQSLAHLVTESTASFWLLFSIPEITARADVVQFNPMPKPDGDAKTPPASPP